MRRNLLVAGLGSLVVLAAGAWLVSTRSTSRPSEAVPVPQVEAGVEATPVLSVGADRENAMLVVEEYVDFACPHCADYWMLSQPMVAAEYDESSDVRLETYDLAHPQRLHSRVAAVAARCAGVQGRYREAADLLFSTQAEWVNEPDRGPIIIREKVENVVMDQPAFVACILEPPVEMLQALDRNYQRALAAEVTGTPAFVLRTPVAQRTLLGALTPAELVSEIESDLSR